MRIGRVAIINGLGLAIVILIGLILYYIWHQGYYFYSTDDAQVTATTVNVASPAPAIVGAVQVTTGQQVARGATIATLRPAPGSGAGSGSGSAGGATGASGSGAGASGTGGGGSSSGNSGGSAGGTSSGGSGSGSGGASSGGSTGGASSGGSGSAGTGGAGTGGVAASEPVTNAVSPIAGNVVSIAAQPGQMVGPGQVIALVTDPNVSITAYVDESHINDVQVNQGVDVTVDAVSDTTFHGSVSRIIPATASTFSLLPVNNYASGNYTKVAQRIPVQITLNGLQGKTLIPGSSANVTIHIHQ